MRRAILAVIGLASAIGGVDEARAQFAFGNKNFGIAIGGGGVGVAVGSGGYGRYGYGGYGYGSYGYPGYAPGYYGYNPYGTSVNVVVPVAPRTSGPTYVRRSEPVAPRERPGAGLPIKIVSPDDAGAPIRYTLNEFEYTIAPGESQTIANDRDWVITFDRGGDFGTAQYSMSPGLYTFALTDQGWQVYHDADLSKIVGRPTSTDSKTIAKNELPEPK